MSNTYVKKYDVGQIKLDLPYANYIHELPLLSFGDVFSTVRLGIVFNRKMKQEEKNNSSIASGYRINLQKCIDFNNNTPQSFQDESGKCICLINNNNIYTFKDNSKRVMRITGDGYEIEYPDFSKEYYNSNGNITFLFDKYGDKILEYSYNSSDQLASITYRSSKTVSFTYEANKLKQITYAGESIFVNYINEGNDVRIKISHYSEVDYHLKATESNYEAYSTNKSSGYLDEYCEKWICTNNSNTLIINKMLGFETVDTNTYEFLNYSEATGECNLVDTINKFDVRSRIQLEDGSPMYSYEVVDDYFIENNTEDSIYPKTIFLYNKNDVVGYQSEHDGMNMEIFDNNSGQFNMDGSNRASGCFVLSGWMNVGAGSSCTFTIRKPNTPVQEYCSIYTIPVIKNEMWQYFCFGFNATNVNGITVAASAVCPKVFLKDLRLTFQSGTIGGYSYLRTLAKTEDVLIKEGESDLIFPLNKCKFYIGDNLLNQRVRTGDILKYKINQHYDLHSGEIYYNDSRGIIVNTGTFKMQYEDGALLYEFPVTDLAVGQRIYKNGKEYITKTDFYTKGNSTNLTTESYIDGNSYKKEIYDEHLDIIRTIMDGVTTYYERDTKGLVTKEEVIGLYRYDTAYSDNLVTVSKVVEEAVEDSDEFEDQTVCQKKYYFDEIWGRIDRVEILDGNDNVISIVDNTYDGDTTLTGISFGDNSQRNHTFGYTNGRLSSLASGTLNYTFGYSDKGELARISKNNSEIESYEYSENADGNTVNTHYNSHSVLQKFDKYGRLTELTGILRNTYDASPTYSTSGGYKVLGKDNISGKIAKSEDLITNQTTKYAYEQDRLARVGTIDANVVIKEETYEYDDADRLTKDHFIYNKSGNKSVTGEIGYVTSADLPVTDNKVSSYTCKVNGTVKAQTSNTFEDPYNRITKKTYTVGGKSFSKHLFYNRNKVSATLDKCGNINIANTTYGYDATGRINSINNGNSITYEYDAYGQLTKEVNNVLDKTFDYVYNGIGNILSVKTTPASGSATTKSFTYNGDRLTSYGGTSISYNAMGCPILYGNKHLDWANGRLTKYYDEPDPTGSLSSESVRFEYNAYGQRTLKEYVYDPGSDYSGDFLIGTTSEYTYDHSGRLVRELITDYFTESASVEKELIFLYDESGMIGVMYSYNGSTPTPYYYQRNLQGDVVAIYDTNGSKKASYSYDAYGNCTTTNSALYDIAYNNPIRYRGYYYDRETNFYYLNSRYYFPEWRRFISPDDTAFLDSETPNGLNLYCYCNNDPVNYADPSGHEPKWWDCLLVAGLSVGAIVLTIASCGAASSAIAPIAMIYFGMSANTTLAITTAVVAATSIGIGAFAIADIQSILTDGQSNYLSFLGDSYDEVRGVFYFASYFIGYIGQFANPGWGKQTSGNKKAPSNGSPYGAYTRQTPQGNDVTIYNGRGQAIVRYDFSHDHGGMIPHIHSFKWWIHDGIWRWNGHNGTVSPYE